MFSYTEVVMVNQPSKHTSDKLDICSGCEVLTKRINDIEKNLENIKSQTSKTVNNTVADNHTLDDFYKKFEDEFRGSEELILERLKDYDDLFAGMKNKQLPIIDIGCGRGEFLGYITKTHKLDAIGVDMNGVMVARAKELGYSAVENDALSYLSKQKSDSISAIVGFHIVEHVPFDSLLAIFQECYRSLHENGFVLFETPNPENIIVGACNFYYDPSHIRPLPPRLLAFALESVGFEAEIKYLHASKNLDYYPERDREIFSRFYGPMDYAVIATKKSH